MAFEAHHRAVRTDDDPKLLLLLPAVEGGSGGHENPIQPQKWLFAVAYRDLGAYVNRRIRSTIPTREWASPTTRICSARARRRGLACRHGPSSARRRAPRVHSPQRFDGVATDGSSASGYGDAHPIDSMCFGS
jgi:hypothetical protein